MAQQVVLNEEDSNDPQGKAAKCVGPVIWRTETVSPGPGLAPELAVRADVEIPGASYNDDLDRSTATPTRLCRHEPYHRGSCSTCRPISPAAASSNVPGILMKQSEQARGTPLAGLAVKVTNGFFLIGLSAVKKDMQRNIQLLKGKSVVRHPDRLYQRRGAPSWRWKRGTSGDRAFADAFAAWEYGCAISTRHPVMFSTSVFLLPTPKIAAPRL